MALVCPRCQRANPDIAEFCYNDGALLRQGAGQAPSKLSREFVFPSGKRCQNFDELAQGCQDEWIAARELLKKGVFGQYFSAVGRLDLARATQEAMALPDPDIGLTAFLGALPISRHHVPRLDINPRRILLGNMLAGDSKQIPISISNQGQGTLQGSLKITEGGDWLKPVGSADGQCLIKAPREQQIVLNADTKKLQAAQTYGAKLTVVTNGGVVEVPVRMDVVAHPFPRAPFQGARTPREMAEKMRGAPKQAVPLLESGEVGRWFKANGWNYPIPGTPAKGVAGVQQFFEAMGLSKPPPVQVSQKSVELSCKYPDNVRGQVSIQTNSKKWVYANVESDSPWLKVLTPLVTGPQQAAIGFEVDAKLVPGQRAEAKLTIVANGGQTLPVRVSVQVTGAPKKAARRKGLLQPVLVMTLAMVLLRLALFPVVDFMSRGPAARRAAGPPVTIHLEGESPLQATAGWLSLPWNRILLGSEEYLPRGLFTTRHDTTDRLPKEIEVGKFQCVTYGIAPDPSTQKTSLSKACQDDPAKADYLLAEQYFPPLFAKWDRPDLARAAEEAASEAKKAPKEADITARIVGREDAIKTLTKEKKETPTEAEIQATMKSRQQAEEMVVNEIKAKGRNILIQALEPVKRSEYRHYYVASFIRNVVFWTWWLGVVAGGMILWRRGGAADLPWGLVAGAVAGIVGSATLACILLVGDVIPQFLWSMVGGGGNFALLLFLWLPLVLFCWALLGAGLGLLCAFVKPMQTYVLPPAQQGLAWLCRLCRLHGLAAYFAPA